MCTFKKLLHLKIFKKKVWIAKLRLRLKHWCDIYFRLCCLVSEFVAIVLLMMLDEERAYLNKILIEDQMRILYDDWLRWYMELHDRL